MVVHVHTQSIKKNLVNTLLQFQYSIECLISVSLYLTVLEGEFSPIFFTWLVCTARDETALTCEILLDSFLNHHGHTAKVSQGSKTFVVHRSAIILFFPLCAFLSSGSLIQYIVILYWSTTVIFLCLLSVSQCSQQAYLNIISHRTAQRVYEHFMVLKN